MDAKLIVSTIRHFDKWLLMIWNTLLFKWKPRNWIKRIAKKRWKTSHKIYYIFFLTSQNFLNIPKYIRLFVSRPIPVRILVKHFPLTRVIVNFITLLGVNKVAKICREVIKYLSSVNIIGWIKTAQLMSNRKKGLLPKRNWLRETVS